MAGNADVLVGDVLTTSGVDGVYPPGLPVATVSRVERRSDVGFARILLTPASGMDGVRHLLVLEPMAAQMTARPDPPPIDKSAARATTRSGLAGRPAARSAEGASR